MMLVISTQVYENYAWNEDGTAVGTGKDAYWKAKGGSEYKILDIPQNVDLEEIVSVVRSDIERANDYFMEDIVSYSLQPDDYLSWFEKSQLEYDGEIQFKEPTLDYGELVDRNCERGYN